MQVWMKNCLCEQACNTLSHSNQRMAELHENKKLKRVLTNEIKKSIVIKVVRTTDRKAGISASPWHE